jgi:hypothetical protein
MNKEFNSWANEHHWFNLSAMVDKDGYVDEIWVLQDGSLINIVSSKDGNLKRVVNDVSAYNLKR